MHPVMVEALAAIHREDLLAHAAQRRRFGPVPRPARWRRVLAASALRLARRLDAAAVGRARQVADLH